ncbi:MAG: hypothetical protein VB035_03750 [Candidatus Fimivivens sp.]|nr:hypothetical protein [Candidatus Fimivivens sp.]
MRPTESSFIFLALHGRKKMICGKFKPMMSWGEGGTTTRRRLMTQYKAAKEEYGCRFIAA